MLNDEAIKAFRRALGSYVTGVTVLTTLDEQQQPRGLTANSFTSVSLSPPLVLMCVAKSSSSLDAFVRSGVFAVNVLSDSQQELSNLFASKNPDKFSTVKWRHGQTGTPLIDQALAFFECRTVNQIDAGDHVIFLGQVQAFSRDPAEPLVYRDGRYVEVKGESSQPAQQTRVGALLECDGAVLFKRSPDGKLHLPCASRMGPESDSSSLLGSLAGQAVDVWLEKLYSVFDHREGGKDILSIYYIGGARSLGRPEAGFVGVPVSQIDMEEIADVNERFILQRFMQEHAQGFYSLYSGGAGMRAQIHQFAAAP